MPINIENLKRKHGQNVVSKPRKPSLIPKSDEPEFEDMEIPEPESPKILEKKRELIGKIFDENADLPVEELLLTYFTEGEGKKMGKTVSPLKGIREGLEDMLNIQQLTELWKGFRDMRKNPEKKVEEEEPMEEGNNLLAMLPFLQRMQNGGMDLSKIDPMMMYMAMGMGGQKQSNNMGQLFLMMSMANMFAQQPQQQTAPNGTPIQPQPNLNMEMIKSIYSELQNVMKQQQKPAIDPNMMMLFQMMNKSSQQPQNTQNLEIIFDKLNTMMQNNQTQQMAMIMNQANDRFERGMEMIAGALNREKPEDKLMKNFSFFREITGDKRQRTKDEMEYDIRKKELEIKEFGRRDMLDREERQMIRDEQKSQRIMDTAGIVLDKVIGNNLGNLVGDLMSAKGSDGKRRGRARVPEQEQLDPSLLDEL